MTLWSVWWACAADPLADLILVGVDPSDAPIAGLSAEWLDRFADGDALFDAPYLESQGLGPAYIRPSCASCHADDGRGPGEVQKFSVVGADGWPVGDPLPYGHTTRPLLAGGGLTPVLPPAEGALITTRAPNPVFGRGYLEAVDPEELERLESEQAARGDAIRGRINRVRWSSDARPDTPFHAYGPGATDLQGRFGLKGRIATLDEFAADALQGDMSITSPLRPAELPNPDGLADDHEPGVDVDIAVVDALADYVRLLAIPARADLPGADLFAAVGCDACHVPALRTRADYPIEALADIDAEIYSDLLVHDLGSAYTDGLIDGSAGPTDWKTAPLMGLRFLRSYLHDGRAPTVEAAILDHRGDGSEANAVIDAFEDLSDGDRAELVSFVESL